MPISRVIYSVSPIVPAPRFKSSDRPPPNPPKISLSPFREKKMIPAVSKCSIYVTSILSKNLYTAREDDAKSGVEAETAISGGSFSQIVAYRVPSAWAFSGIKGEREKKYYIHCIHCIQ